MFVLLTVGLCPPLYPGTGYITDALGEVIEPISTNFFVGSTYTMICNPGTTTPSGSSTVTYTCNSGTWSPSAMGCNGERKGFESENYRVY